MKDVCEASSVLVFLEHRQDQIFNSGTESQFGLLWHLSRHTPRETHLVFKGGYHGGLGYLSARTTKVTANSMNCSSQFVIAPLQ